MRNHLILGAVGAIFLTASALAVTGGRGISQQGTFLQSGTGATLRTIESKLRDTVSAKDFGVTCDGSDEHVKIQAAIDAQVLGGFLYFPANPAGGPVTCGIGSVGITMPAGGKRGIQCDSANSVTFSYTGSGSAFTVGTTLADTPTLSIYNCGIDLGSAQAGANALNLIRVTGGDLRNVIVTGTTGATTLGTGILLDGTGNFTGSIQFNNVIVTGNYTKGIFCQGAVGNINTCNSHSFVGVTIARTTAKPGTGTIGFHFGQYAGDSRLNSIDVEGYDTGYQMDGRFAMGWIRIENCTTGVAFGATGFNNFLAVSPFTITTLATYAGGQAFNSLIETGGFVANVNNGSIDSTFVLQERGDRKLFFDLGAGTTADQQVLFRFLDKSGTPQWRLWKNAFNNLFLDDGTRTRLQLLGGTPDNTDLLAAGTGAINLNKLNPSGTGGICFGDGAGNCKATIDSTGKITNYLGIATAGIGSAAIYGTPVLLTAQTANLAATNVYAAAPVGEYRVCATARTTTSGTGTTANLNIIWTDEGGVKTDAVGTWALNSVTVTGQINKCEYIHAAAATNIQVSVTAGTYGTSMYALSATAERLN